MSDGDKKKGKGKATLDSMVKNAPSMTGLRIANCAKGDVVSIATQYSLYVLEILDPLGKKVTFQGGTDYPDPIEVIVAGTSLVPGSSAMCGGFIVIGRQCEFTRPPVDERSMPRWIRTSVVRMIFLNDALVYSDVDESTIH